MSLPIPTLRLALLGTICTALGLANGLSATDRPVIPLWPAGAPGAANGSQPETVRTAPDGSLVTSGVHQPSLTVYLPASGHAIGAGVIVAPGGSHRELWMDHEGHNVAQWLADHGIAAFVLKYRLARDSANPAGAPQPYTIDRDELDDAQRALRLVRSRAAGWGVDPARVGIIGFSAGGEVALLAATRGTAGTPGAADPLDRLSSRPDFFGLIYPGGLARTDIVLDKDTPPAFLACGYGDRADISEGLAEFYLKCKRAGVAADLHIYARAGHGFGVRASNQSPSATWIDRFADWLGDRQPAPTP